MEYNCFQNKPFQLSILTQKNLDGQKYGGKYQITGYSQVELKSGDTLVVSKTPLHKKYFLIKEMLEVRDAKGNFTKTNPKNLHCYC